MNKREHKLFSTWNGMMSRCYVKSDSRYKYYGAKGVRVSERWHSFPKFVEDVDNHLNYGYLLYKKEYELDKDLLEVTFIHLKIVWLCPLWVIVESHI